jgi:hypothetical protein
VNHHDGPAFHRKMLFEMLTGSACRDTAAKKNHGADDGQDAALSTLNTHIN